jgi:hypothetical protein
VPPFQKFCAKKKRKALSPSSPCDAQAKTPPCLYNSKREERGKRRKGESFSFLKLFATN